jgi:hypothetical protein
MEAHEADNGLKIDADGTWFYEGKPLERLGLVRLFYSVLKNEEDRYYIVTPVEKVPVDVEDAPYSVVAVRKHEQGIDCILNDETLVNLTNACVPRIASNHALYIQTPNTLQARFTRSAFSQLTEWIQETPEGSYLLESYSEKIYLHLK